MQDGDEDCGEKKAHRGRIDWSPGKCFALPQIKKKRLVGVLVREPERIFLSCLFSHMQFLFGI